MKSTSAQNNETGVASVRTEALEDEIPPPPKPMTSINLDIVKKLNEMETLSYNDLIEGLNLSREELNILLNNLLSKGYVEITGEYVTLTDKGRKLLELMREKYTYMSTQ